MSSGFGNYFINYLLLPFIVIILSVISVIIAKKNQILSEKKAVFYVLLSSLTIALFGLCGFFGIDFRPYIYCFIQFLMLLIGFINVKLIYHFIPALKQKNPAILFVIIIVQLLIGWALFSILFNVSNDLQFGLWAGTSLLPILFYPLFYITYHLYLKIPAEIYKMKVYNPGDTFEPPHAEIDVEDLMVCEIEVPKFIDDKDPIRIKAKTVKSFVFANWFGMIITDYNQKKADNQVELLDSSSSYGWIFYTERSFFKSRRYIDPDKSFEENNLTGTDMVIAKRVKNID